MPLRRLAAPLVFALVAATSALAQSVSKDAANVPGGPYQLDSAHSQILFSVFHIGLTDYYGRFDRLSGTLSFEASQPERSAVSISIDTASVDTPSARLAEDLRSPDAFDTAQFANATFKSTSIVRTGATTGRIIGDLTIRNITKPVTLDVVFNGGEENPMSGKYAIGFKATAVIKRSEFGLTSMPWSGVVSDEVSLIIEAMFEHEKI